MRVGDDHLKAYLGGVVQGWFRVSRRAHKSPCFSESVAEHADSTHPPERRTPRFAQCFGLLRTFSGTTNIVYTYADTDIQFYCLRAFGSSIHNDCASWGPMQSTGNKHLSKSYLVF